MRTDGDRTTSHRHIENATGAVQDIFTRLLSFEDAGHADGLIQGAQLCRQTTMQQCLVQMKVRLNQSWNDCAAAGVDAFYRRYLDVFFNGCDLAVFYANIH